MHALHMWTRLISALMFISVPLFASQNNQKHTDQCVSNGVWWEQVSQKNTSWTTCRSVCISTSAFMLYVVVAQMRVSFWLKRACGLTGPVVNQILHRGVVAMKQAPEIWMKNVFPYGRWKVFMERLPERSKQKLRNPSPPHPQFNVEWNASWGSVFVLTSASTLNWGCGGGARIAATVFQQIGD